MPVTHIPVSEQIMEALVKRLRNCRYIQQVVRLLKAPDEYTPQVNQIVVVGGQPSRLPELDCPSTSPAIGYSWQINITANVLQSERSRTPLESSMEVARADIIKAVTTPTAWWTMDSLAINCHWASPQHTFGAGFQSVNQPLIVMYRVRESDPYTVHL